MSEILTSLHFTHSLARATDASTTERRTTLQKPIKESGHETRARAYNFSLGPHDEFFLITMTRTLRLRGYTTWSLFFSGSPRYFHGVATAEHSAKGFAYGDVRRICCCLLGQGEKR
jgi:hypothetical protein